MGTCISLPTRAGSAPGKSSPATRRASPRPCRDRICPVPDRRDISGRLTSPMGMTPTSVAARRVRRLHTAPPPSSKGFKCGGIGQTRARTAPSRAAAPQGRKDGSTDGNTGTWSKPRTPGAAARQPPWASVARRSYTRSEQQRPGHGWRSAGWGGRRGSSCACRIGQSWLPDQGLLRMKQFRRPFASGTGTNFSPIPASVTPLQDTTKPIEIYIDCRGSDSLSPTIHSRHETAVTAKVRAGTGHGWQREQGCHRRVGRGICAMPGANR